MGNKGKGLDESEGEVLEDELRPTNLQKDFRV